MASIHILTSSGSGVYQVVAHFNTPSGTNAAGVTWKSCIIFDERNTSILKVPMVTQAEIDTIISGDVIEAVLNITKLESGGASSMRGIIAQKVNEAKTQLQQRYKHFGRTL